MGLSAKWTETLTATKRCVSQELYCHVGLVAGSLYMLEKEKYILNSSSAITSSFALSYLTFYNLIFSYIEWK